MSAIRKSLLQLMFSGSYMRRWNDKLRPVELYEIDKQAHKMIVAWMLTLLNSGGYSASDQLKLQQEVIERGLFDYLYRLVTTDIKPPVFYRICENEKDYKELTEWVLKELRPVLGAPDEGFWERLSAYHRNRDRTSLPDRILTAAHHYASGWEYNVIKPFNTFDEENQSIAESFTERLDGLTDLCGVNELIQGRACMSSLATAAQIGQTIETLSEGFGNGLIFLVKRVEWLDDVVFPPRSVVVGRRENAIREARPIPVPVVGGKALPETFVRRAEHGAKLFEDPFRQFFVIFLVFTDTVKYGGLDVGCDQTVQIIKKPSFYNFLLQFKLI